MHFWSLYLAALLGTAGKGFVAAAPQPPRSLTQQVMADRSRATDFKCDLPPAVSPDGDGLPSADELFANDHAFRRQVARHSAIVRVPSISYDDLGDVWEDERWLVFLEFHKVLEELFPAV